MTRLILILTILLAGQTIRVDVNLVNVFATVQDEAGQYITNLDREDFRIYEDDVLQEAQIFEKQDDVKSSIAILVDNSGSMVDILPFMRRGIRDFTRTLAHEDDLFVVSFGTSVQLIHSSPEGQQHLEESMERLRPYGTSVLFDSLVYGMNRITGSGHPRKALVVFTDGNDNGSDMSYKNVVDEAQRTGVLLYFVAIGPRVLVDANTVESLSSISGGRTLYVPKGDSVSAVLAQIRTELARQYYIGYYAPRQPGFHRIRVEVPGKNLKVRAKTAYRG